VSLSQSTCLCQSRRAIRRNQHPRRRDYSPSVQVSCNRVLPVCSRCRDEATGCRYSRSGTIHRKRRKREDKSKNKSNENEVRPAVASASTPGAVGESITIQSHLTKDIEATRGLLHGLGASHDTSLGALTSLSEACAAVWHNAIEFDSTSKGYFLFEDQAETWVESEIQTPCLQVCPIRLIHMYSIYQYSRAWPSNPCTQTR
jgi:hypothetical protein